MPQNTTTSDVMQQKLLKSIFSTIINFDKPLKYYGFLWNTAIKFQFSKYCVVFWFVNIAFFFTLIKIGYYL